MTNTTTMNILGYKVGTWTVDPDHSEVGFSIRHMMISKVSGTFEKFDATFTTTPDPLDSSVTASVDAASVNTKEAKRDAHLRADDFFDADSHPTLTFVSTGARETNGGFYVDGDLTIKGIMRSVTFEFAFGGFTADSYGQYKAGATAKTQIERSDFGLTYNAALEAGGMMLGDTVTITLEFQAVFAQE